MHTSYPCIEIFFGVYDYPESHVRMSYSTEFCALTVVFSHFVSHHPEVVVIQRDHINLAGDFWDPETVYNIL